MHPDATRRAWSRATLPGRMPATSPHPTPDLDHDGVPDPRTLGDRLDAHVSRLEQLFPEIQANG